jgi:hypothetical protein
LINTLFGVLPLKYAFLGISTKKKKEKNLPSPLMLKNIFLPLLRNFHELTPLSYILKYQIRQV